MDKHKKTVSAIILVAAGLVVGLLIGFLTFGMRATQKQSEETKKIKDFVDVIAPKPPEVITSAVAIIKKVEGNSITLEMNDPEDYIPRVDGTAMKKITRSGAIDTDTKITIVNPVKIDANGRISEKDATVSDLKEGDSIYFSTSQNIRTEKTFTLLTIKKTVMEFDEKYQ